MKRMTRLYFITRLSFNNLQARSNLTHNRSMLHPYTNKSIDLLNISYPPRYAHVRVHIRG